VDKQLVQREKDEQSGGEAGGDGKADVARDDPEDVGALRAEGHADSKLVGALSRVFAQDDIAFLLGNSLGREIHDRFCISVFTTQ
jgi:hypothetical protein